jgi:hypothetical protein
MLTTKILYETSKKEGDLQNIKNKNKKQIYKKNKKIEEENIKINNKINKKNISPSSYDIIVEGEDDLKKIIDNNNIKNTNIKDYPKKNNNISKHINILIILYR